MEFNVSTEKNWHTTITVTVPAADVKPEYDSVFSEFHKNAKVGGFRKGKVPASLVKKMFGKQIEAEVFQPLFAEAWKKTVEDKKYDLINEPYITNVKYDENEGLFFNIEFDVRPDFQVENYEGLEIEKPVYEITDDDVNETLENLRQRNAMIYTVDGEAVIGNYLVADLQETTESGAPLVGSKYESQQIWLNEENTELIEQLLGIKAGESRHIVLTMPADSAHSEENEPRKQSFFVTVKEVKERRLPDLDDEFAKDIGPFKTVDELTQDIRDRLTSQYEYEARYQYQNALVDAMVKNNELLPPPSMLNNYLAALVRDFKKQNNGKSKVSDEAIIKYYTPTAERTLKWLLMREKLASQLNLSVTDAEVDARIKTLEEKDDESKRQAMEFKDNPDLKIDLKERILEEKVYDFLTSKAKVTTVTKSIRPKPQAAVEEEKTEKSE